MIRFAQHDPNAFTWKDVPKGLETAYDLTENVDDPKYMDAVLDALRATEDPDERAVLETRLRMMSERMRGRESGGLINESNLRRFKGRHPLRFAQESNLSRFLVDDHLVQHSGGGGYPLLYYTENGEVLCPECADKEYQEFRITGDWPSDDPIQWGEIYYEGPAEICAACYDMIEAAYGDPAEIERERLYGWKGGEPPLETEARKVRPVILDKAPEEEATGVSNPDVDAFLQSIDISDVYTMAQRAIRIMEKKTAHVQGLIEGLTQDGIFTEDTGNNLALVLTATGALRDEGFFTKDLTPRRLVAKIRTLHNKEV